jgi:hypothetical protein
MDTQNDVTQDSSPETEVVETQESTVVSEDVKTQPESPAVKKEKVVPYERFQQVNDELSKLKNQPKPEYNLTLEAIKIGKKLEKYSDDEIDSVAKIIKSNKPEDILSALDNSFIKQGIELEREKIKESNKIPGSSSSGFTSDEKSSDEVKNMTPEEHRKYFEKQMRKGQGI